MAEIIDINVSEVVENIQITTTENLTTVNINKVTGSGAVWGEIEGTLSNQTDLQNALNLKANVNDLGAVAFSNDYNDLDNKPNAVPYTGATQDVDLGNNKMNAQSFHVKGTGGNGHIGLKHQSSNASANANETSLFAGANGELYYKNDGNTVQQVASQSWTNSIFTTSSAVATQIADALVDYATKSWVNSQGFITNVITALGYTPENAANKSTSTSDITSTTKFPVWSAIVSYFSASQIRSILGISTLSGSNTGDQDLSGLALKQMNAYSMRVNNTNATANATEIPFQQTGKGTYTGTITWTGTTAPSGTTSHSYNWQRVGNLVTLNINLVYGTAGTSLTAVSMGTMSDFPTPVKPDGLTAASNILYSGVGKISPSETTFVTGGFDVYLRSNSANNGFEFVLNQAALNAKVVRLTISYFTA